MTTIDRNDKPVEAETFVTTLEAEIRQHEAVRHPFLARFATEPLTLKQIQTFGLQHYQLVKVFVNYMTNLLPKIPDPDAAELFRHVFDDEFGQHTIFRSHPALYRNFLRALGLKDEDWGRVALLPETSAYIAFHLTLTREGDFLTGLGAIGPGHEFSIPLMFEDLLTGFRRNTSVTEDDLEYFTMHIIEDKDHAEIFNTLILRHAQTEDGRRKIRGGVMQCLEARRRFWAGCQRVVFG